MARAKRRDLGKRLCDFVERLSAPVEISETPPATRDKALATLKAVAASGEWAFNREQFPSLPNRPGFLVMAGPGQCRSKLTIPPERRVHYRDTAGHHPR